MKKNTSIACFADRKYEKLDYIKHSMNLKK